MDLISAFLLAITMAVDSMCVGATDGILEPKMKYPKILLIAFSFGLFQFLMPVIGYYVGYAFKSYIDPYIPWIAFVILLILGLKSIIGAVIEYKDNKNGACAVLNSGEKKKVKYKDIFVQSIATSIDALTIGFIYTDKSNSEALITFAIIGVVTIILSFITTLFGRQVGCKLEKIAPYIAGVVLIGLAIKFLIEGII